MSPENKNRFLRIALVAFGAIFFLIYPLGMVWPAGWVWHGGEGQYYLQMIAGVYAVLGDTSEHGHLTGDVPALLLVAGVLWFLSPGKTQSAP